MSQYQDRDDEGRINHTQEHPCPVCGGHASLPSGIGERCSGFTTTDGKYAFCQREEFANGLPPTGANERLYRHYLLGECRCGESHADGAGSARGDTYQGAQYNRRVTRYDIADADGTVLATHVRVDFTRADGTPDKTMWWEFPPGSKPKLRDLPLYGLPALYRRQVREGEVVYLTEGERACDELIRRGLPALGTVTGAGIIPVAARLAVLFGYNVALWPDHDTDVRKGPRHMARIAEQLTVLDVAIAGVVEWPEAPEGGDAADYFARGGTVAQLPSLIKPIPEVSNRRDDFRILDVVAQNALPLPDYAIDVLLQYPTLVSLFGHHGTFKTAVAVDVGCHLASDLPDFHGIPIRRHGPVLYIAGEDDGGVMLRRVAWERHYTDGQPVTQFCLMRNAPRLMRADDVDLLCDVLETDGRHWLLIVVETLTKAMLGGEQEKASDMTAALTSLRRLQAYADIVLFTHHSGWSDSDRTRGSSTLPADCETLWRTAREGNTAAVTVTLTKQKNGPDGQSFTLDIEPVELEPATAERLAVTSVICTGDASDVLEAGLSPLGEVRVPKRAGRKKAYTAQVSWDQLHDGMSYKEWERAVTENSPARPTTFYTHVRRLTEVGAVVKRDMKYYRVPGDHIDFEEGAVYQTDRQ